MNLTIEDVATFALAELNTFNLKKLHLNHKTALNKLKQDINTELDELNSSEVKMSRWNYFKIPNTKVNDFEERVLDLGGGKKLIYGIRHLGGDRSTPFLYLKPNYKFLSKSDVFNVYDSIKRNVSIFKPLYLCWWSDNVVDADIIGSTYMVACASDIKKIKPWDDETLLDLKRVTDDSFYSWYKRGYENFHKQTPSLKKKVTMNSLESMKDSMESGLLYDVMIGKERIGLISAERSPLLGHPAIYFHEIYIDNNWRGRGLAKSIQRKFILQNAKAGDYIWGTIDNSNLSSYKTALSNRRRPIRYECFARLELNAL